MNVFQTNPKFWGKRRDWEDFSEEKQVVLQSNVRFRYRDKGVLFDSGPRPCMIDVFLLFRSVRFIA